MIMKCFRAVIKIKVSLFEAWGFFYRCFSRIFTLKLHMSVREHICQAEQTKSSSFNLQLQSAIGELEKLSLEILNK